MRYDVIVSGLGPGGATTASELGRAGLSVLAIDKKVFPRYKPCGGGLSARILNLLRFDIQHTVDATVKGIRFCYPGKQPYSIYSHQPIAYMVRREHFDQFLLREARGHGVEVREGEAVLTFRERDEGVDVTTGGGQYHGKFLVGADGAHSVIARGLNPGVQRRRVLALEEEIPVEDFPPDQKPDEVFIDLGSAPGGYAWRFPKSGFLSVGMAGFNGYQKSLLGHFAEFKSRQRFGTLRGCVRTVGHPLPVYDANLQGLASRRVLLVGDAGNLVDPFLGEGIYYAIQSGQIAARTLIRAVRGELRDCTTYRDRIAEEMVPDFLAAEKVSRIAYAFPQIWYEAMERFPEVPRAFYEILQGSETYPGLVNRLRSQVGRLVRRGLTDKLGAVFKKVIF